MIFFAAVGLALFGGSDEVSEPEEVVQIETVEQVSQETEEVEQGIDPNLAYNLTSDLTYVDEDANSRQVLDIYTPKDQDGPFPLLIWVHGGAWVTGDKSQVPLLDFIDEGIAVAAVNYRFALSSPYPAQVEDVSSAIEWLRANADEYKLDVDDFALVGHSAGAQIALVVALSANSGEYGQGTVDRVLAAAGPYDFTMIREQAEALGIDDVDELVPYTETAVEYLLLGCVEEECPDRISTLNPATYGDPFDPKVYILHGIEDKVVPSTQSDEIHRTLTNDGVFSQLDIVPRLDHGFSLTEAAKAFLID